MGWFFGGGGLYTLVVVFPALGVGRELFCCGASFGFEVRLVVALDWIGPLLMTVSHPVDRGGTGSGLAD